MSNIKEQIRQEIERLKKHSESAKKEWIDEGYNQNAFAEDCRIKSFDKLLDFIDSLPEEKPSDDLNKLIQKWDRIDINTVLKVKVKATGKVIDGFYDGRGHFDHFIDHDVFDRYFIDEVELMPDEEPSEDSEEAVFKEWGTTKEEYLAKSMDKVHLEMEIATYLQDWDDDDEIGLHLSTDNGSIQIELEDIRDLARHFAEWGAKHLK